jgi:hypothetical protein
MGSDLVARLQFRRPIADGKASGLFLSISYWYRQTPFWSEIEDRIMLSPRQLEAALNGEKQTQTSPEDGPEAAGS